MINRQLTILTFLCLAQATIAQEQYFTPVDLRHSTHIASGYFGPNAMQVFDILDGSTDSTLRVEIAGDYHYGKYKDHTVSAFAKIKIPLFTKRVNLSVWWTAQEWYWSTTEKQQHSRVNPEYALHGHATGDIHITTDIQCLYERRWWPDITARIGIKTASSADYEKGRFFDNPAYFTDVTMGKTLVKGDKFFRSLKISAEVGFLCWQTETGRQNDAVMYGAQIKLNTQVFRIAATYSGYSGWEHDGDRPMTVKAQIAFPTQLKSDKVQRTITLEPYMEYLYGIRDYPYQQIRVALAASFDVLKKKRE